MMVIGTGTGGGKRDASRGQGPRLGEAGDRVGIMRIPGPAGEALSRGQGVCLGRLQGGVGAMAAPGWVGCNSNPRGRLCVVIRCLDKKTLVWAGAGVA